MVINGNEIQPNPAQKYVCNFCDYVTSKQCNYKEHLTTRKHKKQIEMVTNGNQIQPKPAVSITCECGKNYKHHSGLSRHKKTCDFVDKSENLSDKELIILLLKENNDLKSLALDVCKNTQPAYSITNSNIVTNKTFNLNFFLNEECKDAMNIMDFVDSLKLQLTDLESIGNLGYVDGISNIIVRNLRALDITKRPVHCSDSKREVLYVKDKNKWEKENEEKVKITKAIRSISNKNIKLLPEWKTKNPDCIYSYSKNSDKYNKIVLESMGGVNHNKNVEENKIIKLLAKEVAIDKEFI